MPTVVIDAKEMRPFAASAEIEEAVVRKSVVNNSDWRLNLDLEKVRMGYLVAVTAEQVWRSGGRVGHNDFPIGIKDSVADHILCRPYGRVHIVDHNRSLSVD